MDQTMQQIIIIKMKSAKPYNKPIINFSNIFSSTRRSPLYKDASNQTHKQIKSKSRSPTPKEGGLTNIPNIKNFREINKIALNSEKMKTMFERLQVQENAQNQFKLRSKNNKLYMDYTCNPFTSQLSHETDKENTKSLRSRNLVQEFNRLRQPKDKQSKSKLKEIGTAIKRSVLMPSQQKTQKHNKQQPNLHPFSIPTPIQQTSKSELQLLDDIVAIKQRKFAPNSQIKNIFTLLFKNNNFKSTQQLIDEYHFCYDSIVTFTVDQKRKTVFKFNSLLSISSYNRQLMNNKVTQKTPQKLILVPGDIILQMERIQLNDLIHVSNNRLSSQNLMKYLRQAQAPIRKKGQGKQKQNEKDTVSYLHNTKNKRVNYDNIDQDKIDIKYYEQAVFNRLQILQQDLSQMHMRELQQTIDIELKFRASTIHDKRLLKGFDQQKNQILLKHLDSNSDGKLAQLMKEVQRKIRINKNNKNRTEKIKIQTLTQSLRIKNQRESYSKSPKAIQNPLKTWRK